MRSNLMRVQIAACVIALSAGLWLVVRKAVHRGDGAGQADQLTARFAEQAIDLAKAKSHVQALEKDAAKAADDLATVRIQRGQAEARAAQWQERAEERGQAEAGRLAKLQEEKEAAVREQAAQLADAKQRAQALQQSCLSLSSDIESLRAERKQSQTRLAELQHRLDEAARSEADRLADARRRADALERVMANLTRDLEAVQGERGQAAAYAAELQTQLTEAGKAPGGAPKWMPVLLAEAKRRADTLSRVSANLAGNLDAIRAERRQAEAAAIVLQASIDQIAKLQSRPPEWLIGLLDRR